MQYLVGFGHELAIIIVPKSSILRVTKSPHLLKTLVSSQPLLVFATLPLLSSRTENSAPVAMLTIFASISCCTCYDKKCFNPQHDIFRVPPTEVNSFNISAEDRPFLVHPGCQSSSPVQAAHCHYCRKQKPSNHKDKPAFIIRDIVYLATPGEEKSMSFASSDLDNVVARESVHKGGNEPSWLPLL